MKKAKILILGGNRFFGRHLATDLLQEDHEVTLLNRGQHEDGLGDRVKRLRADRYDASAMLSALGKGEWDLVYDQTCYTATHAELACTLFKNRTARYIVTSTESVYDNGENQSELAFDPRTYVFDQVADHLKNYQQAKRQMEAVFSRTTNFAVAIVRPSLVVGTDDYTGRLSWHIQRIRNGQPIYFPNLAARSDFIRSDQAGTALKIVGFSSHLGPVNCTSRGSISLGQILAMCEKVVGKKAILADQHEGDNHSPYGGSATKTMDTSLLYSLGFDAPSSEQWMYQLIT